jgi:hypothetical protein
MRAIRMLIRGHARGVAADGLDGAGLHVRAGFAAGKQVVDRPLDLPILR